MPLIQRIDIKTTGTGRPEAALRILGKLLRAQRTVRPLQPAPEADLLRTQAMLRHQSMLFRTHRLFGNNRSAIRRLHPPRKEVPHHPAFRIRLIRRRTPLVVERAIRSIRCAFEHHLSLRRERRPKTRQRHLRVPRPAAHLATVQVLHAQTAAGIQLRCTRYTKLAIDFTKHHLARVRARQPQRTLTQIVRKPFPHPPHRREDRLGSFARMRHLQRQRAGLVMVRRKNRADTHVVMPICRAFSTMFWRPHLCSNARCAGFAIRRFSCPSRVRMHSSVSALRIK